MDLGSYVHIQATFKKLDSKKCATLKLYLVTHTICSYTMLSISTSNVIFFNMKMSVFHNVQTTNSNFVGNS